MKKGLAKNLLPDYYFEKISGIEAEFFSGADLIIFDVDNTLVFSETAETRKEIIDWFNKISSKYKCICLSNSRTIFKREKQISKLLNCKIFLSRHKKPFKSLFKEIEKQYNFSNLKIFLIGDRIFTDILFGNRNRMITILVKPLSNKESVMAKIARKLENAVLFLLKLIYT